MPQTKRQRKALTDRSRAQEASKKRHDATPAPLERFLRLPPELKKRVYELCVPSLDEDANSRDFDSSSTLGLLLASRELYDQVSRIVYPTLFANVYIDRPSGLALFHEAIVARPWLQSLVKSVTIGRKSYGSGFWPHSMAERPKKKEGEGGRDEDEDDEEQEEEERYFLDPDLGVYRLYHGLTKHDLRPKWCRPQHSFSHADEKDDCQTRFALDAISTASKALGAHLDYPPARDHRGEADFFVVDVFNVQAALDLYLLEMRRVEDEEGHDAEKGKECRDLTCGHYPQLKVVKEGEESSRNSRDRAPFVVTKDRIRPHLARRGGPSDDFNCILALARSRQRQWIFDYRGDLDSLPADPIEGVDMDDPQAKAMEVDTFNGAIAMLRSVFALTKPSLIEFEHEEMEGRMGEILQGGWDQRLVEVDGDGPEGLRWRFATEGDGSDADEDAKGEQEAGNDA